MSVHLVFLSQLWVVLLHKGLEIPGGVWLEGRDVLLKKDPRWGEEWNNLAKRRKGEVVTPR